MRSNEMKFNDTYNKKWERAKLMDKKKERNVAYKASGLGKREFIRAWRSKK